MESKTKVKEEVDLLEEEISVKKEFSSSNSERIFEIDAAASQYGFKMVKKINITKIDILDPDLPNESELCSMDHERNYRNDTITSNDFEMDHKINIKEEVDILDSGLPHDSEFCSMDHERNYRNDFEMDHKINVKGEVNILGTGLPHDSELCSMEDYKRNYRNDTITRRKDFEMDHKINIKEEVNILETVLPIDRICCLQDFGNRLKDDAATCGSDFELGNNTESKQWAPVSVISFHKEMCFSSDIVKELKKEFVNYNENGEASVQRLSTKKHCQSEATVSHILLQNENEVGKTEDLESADSYRLIADTVCSETPGVEAMGPSQTAKNVFSHRSKKDVDNDLVLKFKNTTVKCCSCEMDIKIEIKEEVPFSEVTSQIRRESFSQDVKMKLNRDATVWDKVCEMETKTEMNEEAVVSHIRSQNKRQSFLEYPVMKVDACNKDCEMVTKTEIKEELWWLETTFTEPRCVDVIEDLVDESFSSKELIRLYGEELSKGKSVCYNENLKQNARLNMIKDSPECEAARKYTIKEIYVPEISSIEKRIYPEQHEGGEIDSKPSCLKQNNFIQQNSTLEHDFNNKNYYKLVLVKDNMGDEFKCDICEKKYTSPSDLKTHKFIHEGKQLHMCNICDKSSAQLSQLKKHKLIHEGIRPYKCDTCGKCFARLSHLKTHKLIHEDISPHKCETCSKCFTQLSHLKRQIYS